MLTNFEAHLPESERQDISRSVQRGIDDIESGRFEEYDASGLRKLARELVERSAGSRRHAGERLSDRAG